MRKLLWSILVMIVLLVFFGLTSCSLFDDDTPPRDLRVEVASLSSQIWEVTLFQNKGKDESERFEKVFVEFKSNHQLMVTDSACQVQTGEWVLSSDSTLLVIRLDDNLWNDLDDEWVVTLIDENQLRIVDNDAEEEFHFISVGSAGIACASCDEITDILTDSTWVVDHYSRGDTLGTQLFSHLYLKFKADGGLLVQYGESQIQGTWRVIGNCNKIKVSVEQEIFPVSILNEDWFILEFSSNEIILRDERNNILKELHLVKGMPLFNNCSEIIDLLEEDLWHISSFEVNNTDITYQFRGLSFKFLADSSLVLIPTAGDTFLGSWTVDGSQCELLTLDLNESRAYRELSQTWFIKEVNPEEIILVYESDAVRFEMLLTQGAPYQPEECNSLVDLLLTNQWQISFFEDDDDEETEKFEDYRFNFGPGGVLEVLRGDNDLILGNWKLVSGCERLEIDISGSGRLNDIDEVWSIIEYDDERIKLVYEKNKHRKVMHFKIK